jgi:hypothetical protein
LFSSLSLFFVDEIFLLDSPSVLQCRRPKRHTEKNEREEEEEEKEEEEEEEDLNFIVVNIVGIVFFRKLLR